MRTCFCSLDGQRWKVHRAQKRSEAVAKVWIEPLTRQTICIHRYLPFPPCVCNVYLFTLASWLELCEDLCDHFQGLATLDCIACWKTRETAIAKVAEAVLQKKNVIRQLTMSSHALSLRAKQVDFAFHHPCATLVGSAASCNLLQTLYDLLHFARDH